MSSYPIYIGALVGMAIFAACFHLAANYRDQVKMEVDDD